MSLPKIPSAWVRNVIQNHRIIGSMLSILQLLLMVVGNIFKSRRRLEAENFRFYCRPALLQIWASRQFKMSLPFTSDSEGIWEFPVTFSDILSETQAFYFHRGERIDVR
jgi:hypothetical protein